LQWQWLLAVERLVIHTPVEVWHSDTSYLCIVTPKYKGHGETGQAQHTQYYGQLNRSCKIKF